MKYEKGGQPVHIYQDQKSILTTHIPPRQSIQAPMPVIIILFHGASL